MQPSLCNPCLQSRHVASWRRWMGTSGLQTRSSKAPATTAGRSMSPQRTMALQGCMLQVRLLVATRTCSAADHPCSVIMHGPSLDHDLCHGHTCALVARSRAYGVYPVHMGHASTLMLRGDAHVGLGVRSSLSACASGSDSCGQCAFQSTPTGDRSDSWLRCW